MTTTTKDTRITVTVTVIATVLGACLSFYTWGESLPPWQALLLGGVGGLVWGLCVMWGLKAFGRWSRRRAANG